MMVQKLHWNGQPRSWAQLMGVALTTKGMRDIDYIYMGRLMILQAGKLSASDASLIGSTASKEGLYGDAVQAEKLGGTGSPPADAKADSDKKTLPPRSRPAPSRTVSTM